MPNAKETITIRDDGKVVTITSRINEKYARKLLQDFLKDATGIPGMWSLWLVSKDETKYTFEIENPIQRVKEYYWYA